MRHHCLKFDLKLKVLNFKKIQQCKDDGKLIFYSELAFWSISIYISNQTVLMLLNSCARMFFVQILMTFALFAGDSLEVIHLGGCDWCANNLQILNDRLLIARLIVNSKDRKCLDILKLDKSKIDETSLEIFGAHFDVLHSSRAHG